jgi:uncharacterized phage protein gp47/JayE
MQQLYADIPKIELDPRDDATVLTQMYMRVLNASQGKLNKVQTGSVLAAVFEGLVYALAYQRWYLNLLPEAIAIEMMRFSGVARSAGAFAAGEVTILLNSPRSTPVLLSTGTFLPLSRSSGEIVSSQLIGYTVTKDLIIPPGNLDGTTTVQATQLGSAMNVSAFQLSIAGASIGMPYVNSVTNKLPITGGADLEPMYDYIKRVQVEMRSNETLITLSDYETATLKLAGSAAVPKAIGLMDAASMPDKVGNVSVFLCYNDSTLPSDTTCSNIRVELSKRCFAGSYVWVKPMNLVPLQIDITAVVDLHSSTTADAIFNTLTDYLTPGVLPIGGTLLLSELIYVTRGVPGVKAVTNLLSNRVAANMLMPNKWSIPRLDFMFITLVDAEGYSKLYQRGKGFPTSDVGTMVD